MLKLPLSVKKEVNSNYMNTLIMNRWRTKDMLRKFCYLTIRNSIERNVVELFTVILRFRPDTNRWFSTFRMLRPFNTVPHVVVTPNHKINFLATS